MYTYDDIYKYLINPLPEHLKTGLTNFIEEYEKQGITADFMVLVLKKCYENV